MSDTGRHTKRDETAAWWWKRIDAAKTLYSQVHRKHHRKVLHMLCDYQMPAVVVGTTDGLGDTHEATEAVEGVEQINILYIPRYVRWVESQAWDSMPEVTYPRYTDPDTKYGDMLNELCGRLSHESGEMEEWRSATQDCCANGSFAVWYGVHAQAVDRAMLYDAGKGSEEILEETLAGVHEAKPGQDHALAAQVAEGAALGDGSEDGNYQAKLQALSPGGEDIQGQLLQTAAQHRALLAQEQKGPNDRFGRNRLWVQRRPVGTFTLWDPDADDLRDIRWAARKFYMDADQVRSSPVFKQTVTRDLEAMDWWDEDPETQDVQRESTDTRSSNRIVLWEIWDLKYEERHYITKGCDKLLEKDPKNPHVDDDGNPLIDGFFPVVIEAPYQQIELTPERPYGIPVCSPAWPLQRLMVKLLSHNLDAVKKMAMLQHIYHPSLSKEHIAALNSGQTGTGVPAPPELKDNPQNAVTPITYGQVPPQVFQQFQVAKALFGEVLAWPGSQMTGYPQAETATSETLSVQSGAAQVGDFIRRLEDAYARAQRIKLSLVKHYYNDDQIRDLIGNENLAAWKEWQTSSLAGDRVTVRFGVQQVDPVRLKQVGEVLAVLRSEVDPTTLLPKYDTDFIVNEWVRLHGLGKAVRMQYKDEEIMAALQARGLGAQPQGDPKQNGKDKGGRPEERPATSQQMSADVQNVGPSGPGPGRGLYPVGGAR